tara:strand:- start:45 stop:608 length:564 start_codon:yes stop_codon:yes gene_type:complete
MKEEFTYIYDNEKWGVNKGSGEGSRPKFNIDYIAFLEHFLKTNNIKSVIDFGCGDWQFSQYVDWSNIDYLGLDVVDSVIEENKKRFEIDNISFVSSTNVFDYLKDRELIIIKDTVMHWPNEIIVEFMDKLITYDIKILMVNSFGQSKKRMLKRIGGFSRLDYDMYPLNRYNGELIFTYKNKQVVLIQ